MVVGSFSDEFTTPISPKRFWSAAIIDSHILIPKIAPQYIESIEVEGDGGAGTIKTFKFSQGAAMNAITVVKNKVDVLDPENFLYKYSVVGGGGKYASVTFEIKLEATADGGSVCKLSGEYSTVGDYVPTEADSNAAKGGNMRMLKAIEAFLIAKPEAYA